MHWTSLYSPPPPDIRTGLLPTPGPVLVTSGGLETCSFGVSQGVTSGGDYWNTYGFQTVGTHPAGMLSCFVYNAIVASSWGAKPTFNLNETLVISLKIWNWYCSWWSRISQTNGGTNPWLWSKNVLFWMIFVNNCMKMKEKGGACP